MWHQWDWCWWFAYTTQGCHSQEKKSPKENPGQGKVKEFHLLVVEFRKNEKGIFFKKYKKLMVIKLLKIIFSINCKSDYMQKHSFSNIPGLRFF